MLKSFKFDITRQLINLSCFFFSILYSLLLYIIFVYSQIIEEVNIFTILHLSFIIILTAIVFLYFFNGDITIFRAAKKTIGFPDISNVHYKSSYSQKLTGETANELLYAIEFSDVSPKENINYYKEIILKDFNSKYYYLWLFYKKPLQFLLFHFPEVFLILISSVYNNSPWLLIFFLFISIAIKIYFLNKYVGKIEYTYNYFRPFIIHMEFSEKIENIMNTDRKFLAMLLNFY